MKKSSHSFAFMIPKLDKDNGQLLANDESSATSSFEVMTGTVRKLKMRSKTGKVDSVAF